MKILLFRGEGMVSRLIQWQTRSQYNHVAVELSDGSIIEAWEGDVIQAVKASFFPKWFPHDGVRVHSGWHDLALGHKPGTQIDVFSVPNDFDHSGMEVFLKAQIGKPYDVRGVLKFVSRRPAKNDGYWFCSELCHAAALQAGWLMVRGESWAMSPRDIGLTPGLVFDGSRTL